MKKVLFFILTILYITGINTTYASNEGISAWAQKEIEESILLGIVPSDMQSDFQSNITRAEFTKVAVMFVAEHFDMELNEFMEWYLSNHVDSNGNKLRFLESSFSDIDNSEHKYYIQCANSMNIVFGKFDGIFDPDSPITREEAATMLMRVYFCYGSGVKLNQKSEAVDTFQDKGKISSWADSAVRYMYQWDVMKGVSDTQYAPKSYYTKEQCYITFLRLKRVNGSI